MSFLATIPPNVLQNIAFILAIESLHPIRTLASLLLACSSMYRALSPKSCPRLYARIFRETFDFGENLHAKLSDSALTLELLLRHRILWRTRRRITLKLNQQELWCGIRMILEDNGRNVKLLSSAGFSSFMFSLVLQRLRVAGATNLLPLTGDNTVSLMMWLFCLVLKRQEIVSAEEETRKELLRLLRFPTSCKHSSSGAHFAPVPPNTFWWPAGPVELYSDIDHDALLASAAPIIILIFALNEVVPMIIPIHVPKTRIVAINSHRSGPTMEDCLAISGGRTPLFTETRVIGANPAAIMSNPLHLELYKSRIADFVSSTYVGVNRHAYVYVPGFLSGVWEGSFMISGEPMPASPLIPPFLGQFHCLKPMQCAITEYLCFIPHLPIPFSFSLDLLESAVKSGSFAYEKYSADKDGGRTQPLPSDALDVILLGETLPDHERAFGGFKFSGRVRSDGYMIMCREPKNDIDREDLGTWIFEGHLRYGVALVGQWRTSISTATYDLRGIFSLHKTGL